MISTGNFGNAFFEKRKGALYHKIFKAMG